MNIDITTTATIRPELLNRTYDSFKRKLFKKKHNYRVIINIDPIGLKKHNVHNVIRVVRKHFKDVVINAPLEPSFPKAWIWCWKHVNADYVFHLEEDWELLRDVDINHMIKIMEKNKNLAALRMAKMDIKKLHFFNSTYVKKDGYLLALNRPKSFGGNPQLVRGDFIKDTRDFMITTRNPEKQFRSGTPVVCDVVMKWDYGVYGKLGDRMLVKDIGRSWRAKNKYAKDGGPGFLKWKKI